MQTKHACQMEFDQKLTDLILSIQEKIKAQFKYNLETNIPREIGGITFDTAAQHAIDSGLVHAISKMNDWDIEPSVKFAHHILEDVNAHAEARELVKFIPEYQ